MATYRSSRILPIALVIVIIIIAIAALVSLARVVFFSGSTTDTTQVDVSREALLNTSADRSVAVTVRGPIIASEKFRSYQIDISASNRTIKTYSGYLGKVIDQNSLGNNVASYAEFVHALDKADLAKGAQFEGDKNDIRGICATGSVYEFEILKADKAVKTLWTSTCGGSPGSLDASVVQLTNLFIAQIPEAESQIGKLRLKQTLSL